jgi:hypothetical protein
LSIGMGAATPVIVVNLSIELRLSAYPRFRLALRSRRTAFHVMRLLGCGFTR